MTLLDTFCTVFPVRGPTISIELVELIELDDSLSIVARLIVWDIVDDQLTIRDVKEQQVYLGPRDIADDPRLQPCLAGWEQACMQLFAQDDLEWVEVLMPADLIPRLDDLLELKRPRTADDFAEALLASKKRLGQYLAG